MDKVDLSNSPDLSMDEITQQLFNNEFMSDIQFRVGGKVLFAHSWELMKRSIVFREQFRGNLGENKLIPIVDTTYEVFYQFLRFIYTDKCYITERVICDLYKLAVKYKIVKLQNKISNMEMSYKTPLILLEFIMANNHELDFYGFFEYLISKVESLMCLETFLNIPSNVMIELLKYDYMASGMTEIKLFNALVSWMDRSCRKNQTPISQRRSLFDKLIRLIRFPIMTNDEFTQCVKENPNLFTSEDISVICQKITLGALCANQEWISKPRLEFSYPGESKVVSSNRKWQTKFTVSDNLILRGLRYGSINADYKICISGKDRTTNVTDDLSFKLLEKNERYFTINLGESIKVKPNVDYTIEMKFITENKNVAMFCRKPNINYIISGPSKLVTLTETTVNLFEIFFKLPTD